MTVTSSLFSFFLFAQLHKLSIADKRMVIVRGAPVGGTSYGVPETGGLDWESCVSKCLESPTCILAYGDVKLSCYLFGFGDLVQVRNDESGFSSTREKVAFKVDKTGECADGPETVLNGASYGKDHIFGYFLMTEPGFYMIIYQLIDHTDMCGQGLLSAPQCGVCESIMFKFHHITFTYPNHMAELIEPIKLTTLTQCMFECYARTDCFLVYVWDGVCNFYKYGDFSSIQYSFNNTSIDVQGAVGMKYIPDRFTCTLSFSSLFDGRYVMIPTSKDFSAFQFVLSGILFIPRQSCEDADAHVYDIVPGCYKILLNPDSNGLTHAQANEYCAAVGGDGLMTIPNDAAYQAFQANRPESTSGTSFFHIGLIRNETNKWDWMTRGLNLDESEVHWQLSYPKDGENCSQVSLASADNVFVSSRICDDASLSDGLICHFEV